MPRYELVEGTTTKFWEIEVTKTGFAQKWGKVGGSVSSSNKELKDSSAAKKEADKLVAEKVKKGYVLAGKAAAKPEKKAPPAAAGSKPNPELEKAIIADPEAADAYLVYADWLQANGDVRGELAVMQHAGKTRQANALIQKHAEHFLGEFATVKPPTFELEWFCGFIKSATIGWAPFQTWDREKRQASKTTESEECANAFERFLKHPSMRFVQELHLGPVPGSEQMHLDGLAAAIDQVTLPCLRSLYLGEIDRWDISSTGTAMPDSKAIRAIRELTLRGGDVTVPKVIDLPELVSFTVETGGLHETALKAIAAAKWPKIEKLEIWCGDPNYGGSGGVKEIAPILAAKGLPKLKHLGIRNCPFADAVVDKLIGSKILPQLTTLDLSMGNLSDRGVDAMVKAKAAFAHLAELDLDDNALTDASKPKVKGLAKQVNFGKEHDPERAVPRDEDNQWSRYTSVNE